MPLDDSADEFDQLFKILTANPSQSLFIESDPLVHRQEKVLGLRWQPYSHPVDFYQNAVRLLFQEIPTGIPLVKPF
jgi:hypothetical protein